MKTPYLDRHIEGLEAYVELTTKNEIPLKALEEYRQIKEALSELERVKEELINWKKAVITEQRLKAQSEKERDELKDFIIKLSNGSGFLEDTIERLQGKAQQLLTSKLE